MPITVSCPSCSTTLRAPDSAAGRKVKCPKCATPFDVPNGAPEEAMAAAPPRRQAPPPEEDYEDYEEEAPRRRRASSDGSTTGLQTGLGIAALVVGIIGLIVAFFPCLMWFSLPLAGVGLILGVVGLIVGMSRDKQGLGFPIAGASVSGVAILVSIIWIFVIAHAVTTTTNAALDLQKNMQQQMVDQMKQKNPIFNPNPNPNPNPGGGAKVLDLNGQLTQAEPFDKVRKGSKAQIHTVNLTAGKTYQIDMTSGQVDSYLRLENPDGKEVAHDDDSGGFPNARIIYACQRTGAYQVVCTTFGGGLGGYHVTVEER